MLKRYKIQTQLQSMDWLEVLPTDSEVIGWNAIKIQPY